MMTKEQLVALRRSWGWTQTSMANQLGMTMRGYQDIENGRASLRQVHVLAIERLSLAQAALTDNAALMLPTVRTDFDLVLAHLTGLEPVASRVTGGRSDR